MVFSLPIGLSIHLTPSNTTKSPPLILRHYMRRLVIAMIGDSRPSSQIGWDNQDKRPEFYPPDPSDLVWADPSKKPATFDRGAWANHLKGGIGEFLNQN